MSGQQRKAAAVIYLAIACFWEGDVDPVVTQDEAEAIAADLAKKGLLAS